MFDVESSIESLKMDILLSKMIVFIIGKGFKDSKVR